MSYKKKYMSFNIKRHINTRVIFRCFPSAILCCISAQTLPPATTYLFFLFIMCDKPEFTRWCLCSLHAGIQISPDEVVGSRDGCRHSIAERTVDMPVRLFQQIFSACNALFPCPFA